jgi:hypothetical protein
MGNTTTKQVGDLQAGVGKVGADIGVVISTIFAVILIIIAITMVIFALIPVNPLDCPDRVTAAQQQVETMCSTPPLLSVTQCTNKRTDLDNAKQYCSTKHKRLYLLFGLLLIPLALLMIWLSHWWRREVHHSKTAAQVGGTMFELGALQDLFGRN